MTLSAIFFLTFFFLTFFMVLAINMAIIFIHDIRQANSFSEWRVVVKMTSPYGNRYERNVHVEAKNEREARVLAEAEAKKDNKEYTCMARKVVQEHPLLQKIARALQDPHPENGEYHAATRYGQTAGTQMTAAQEYLFRDFDVVIDSTKFIVECRRRHTGTEWEMRTIRVEGSLQGSNSVDIADFLVNNASDIYFNIKDNIKDNALAQCAAYDSAAPDALKE